MSDLSVFAEALIAATARAFYDDDAVCLIDVLLRDKYLRDDDMGPRLSLPIRKLRQTMQFLQEQHLVKYELVDDLLQGGSQQTKFWYIDFNHAVNVIRLRIFLLRSKLEEVELRARSSSFYLCPGYTTKRCNGRYTETEAQQVVDMETGLFLCQECGKSFANNPDAPQTSEYTLQLVDNTKDLKAAEKVMRRLNTQLSAKRVGNHQLRVGIYDLIKKVRQVKGPLSSNLPSENRSMGIGSTRLEGTGRTAGIKAKKLAQQGIPSGGSVRGGYSRASDETELNFLKNMSGEKVALALERGAGAKALQLAQAPKGGVDQLINVQMVSTNFSQRVKIETEMSGKWKRAKSTPVGGKEKKKSSGGLSFLQNNIGHSEHDIEEEKKAQSEEVKAMADQDDEEARTDQNGTLNVNEAFERNYAEEMNRQKALIESQGKSSAATSRDNPIYQKKLYSLASNTHEDDEEDAIVWEDA
jgi:transcription initiation factor IIE alpha subunit